MRTRVSGLTAIAVAVWLAPLPASGQAAGGPANASVAATSANADEKGPPRTPWGHPDLQGVWDYRTITPLERPRNFGDREFLTDAEVAEMEARAAKRMDEPPDPGSSGQTVHPSYWTDPGRRVAESRRTSLIVDPPNGRMPPLSPEGEKRAEQARAARGGSRFDSWLDRTPLERCITWGLPTAILPGLYNNNIRIVQAPDSVAIVHEMVHDTRVIPFEGGPAKPAMRQWFGRSTARWEGDTLVVETTHFTDKTSYRGSSEHMRLIERFTRVDEDTIDFRLTVEDPSTWSRPWTAVLTMRPSEGELYEYACHEGNYALRNMLEVARDEEKAAAEKAAAGKAGETPGTRP